ncbi:MAG: hypothetical protein ACFCVC_12385 [Acidimicrobiia bacterium]
MIEGNIKALSIGTPTQTTWSQVGGNFQASLDRTRGDRTGMGAVTRAAAMVGALGAGNGCACESVVAAAYPPDRAQSAGNVLETATPVVLQPAAVRPGDIIMRSEHMGVALSASRYIAASTTGVIEETWIPWNEVTGIRRPS